MNQLVFEVNPLINMARSYSEYVQTLLSTQAYIRKTYVSPSNSTVLFPQGHPSGDFSSHASQQLYQQLQQPKLETGSQESLYMPQTEPTDQQKYLWPVGYPFPESGLQQSQIDFYLNVPKGPPNKRTRKRKTPFKSALFGLDKELEERRKTKKDKDQEERVEKMQLREDRRLPCPKKKTIVQKKKFTSREFVTSSSSSAISVRKHDGESYIPNHDHLLDDGENDDFINAFNPDSNFVCPLEPRR